MMLVVFGNLLAWAQARPSEYEIKAAYLFDFGKFIRVASPESRKREAFSICIVGRDPMGRTLDELTRHEQIDNRPVHVMRLQDAAEARTCDVAYFSLSEDERIAADIAALGDADVLTVSDIPQFLARGGMIQFVNVGNHVRFNVSLQAVKRTHLELSSELLRVASSVLGVPALEEKP